MDKGRIVFEILLTAILIQLWAILYKLSDIYDALVEFIK